MQKIIIILLLLFAWQNTLFAFVPDPSLHNLQENFSQSISKARSSVVSVKARKSTTNNNGGPPVWFESIGSGIVIDQKGYILSNLHVVENSENITVRLWQSANKTYKAKILHADSSLDLVVLALKTNDLFIPAKTGNSDLLEIGDWVISMGCPFGFDHSASVGIVSDLHRDLDIGSKVYKDMIQTDAVINQGNSGGPLIDIHGNVVGIGTAIYAPEGTYTGLGFAIPINRVKHFYSRITGAVPAAAIIPVAAAAPAKKEPVNLNKKMPGDAIHKEFSDCTKCHIITQKMPVSMKAKMTHPLVGKCTICHIITNDKVIAKAPVTVAAIMPFEIQKLSNMTFYDIFTTIILKLSLVVLVSSILFTMLGVGGGFLYVPILLACGIDFYTAATTSLVMIAASQISAQYNFFKSGLLDLRLVLELEIPTMIGAFAGGMLAHHFNVNLLSLMFACLLFLASYFMMKEEPLFRAESRNLTFTSWVYYHEKEGAKYHVDMVLALPLTFIIGYFGGMLGLACGWLKVPIMVVLFNVPMKIAVATSSLMVPITALSGFLGHSIAGHFDYRLALSLSVLTIIGAQFGSRFSIESESNLLRFVFAFVLSAVGLWMILRVF